MRKRLFCWLLLAACCPAQHIQFGQPYNGVALATPAWDRSGNLLMLAGNIAFGPGPGGSHPVLLVDRYGRDGSSRTLVETGLAGAGVSPVFLAVDHQDRIYVGVNREGQPGLARFTLDQTASPHKEWVELPAPSTRLVGVAFAPDGDPVVLGTDAGPSIQVVRLDSASLAPVAHRVLAGRVGNPRAIAVDTAGAVYIAGDAEARGFQATAGAFQQGCQDCDRGAPFVTKLSPDLQSVAYSTLLSDRGVSGATAIQVAGDGSAYVAGWIIGGGGESPFPTTPGAFQRRLPREFELWIGGGGMILGPSAAFIARLNREGSGLVASTLLGGSLSESISGLGLDEQGRVIAHGVTGSRDFPSTGVFETPCGPDRGRNYSAVFLTRLDPRLERVEKSIVTAGAASLGLPSGPVRGPIFLLLDGSAALADLDRDEPVDVACLVSGASYKGLERVTPGQLVTVFGRGLGPERVAAFETGETLPTDFEGSEVLFNGIRAPLLAAHSSQLNVVVPQELEGNIWMEVRRHGERVFLRHLRWSSLDPDPLLSVTAEGEAIPSPASPYVLLADALNQDGTRNSQENPAAPGSLVTVFVTGLGALDARLPDAGCGDGAARPVQEYQVRTESGRLAEVEVLTVPGRTVAVAGVRFRVPEAPGGVLHFSITPAYSTSGFAPGNFLYVAGGPAAGRSSGASRLRRRPL